MMADNRAIPLVLCLIVAALYYCLVTQLDESFDKMVQSNETLKLIVGQQHKDIKKCLSKLPAEDVKAFFKENREELYKKLHQ